MKKIVLSTICGVLALVMVGCSSNNTTQATKDLNSQIDRLQNTVSNISSSAVYDVTPANYLYSQPMTKENTNESRLKALMTESQYAFAEHESLRQEINSRCATLKSALGNKYKLTNNKVKALKTLTSNISGHITDISSTTHRVNNATNVIKRNKNTQSINADGLNVGYTQLNNELEKRIIFFKNVLSTFDQVESILSSSEMNEIKEIENTNQNQQQNVDTTNTVNNTRPKNIDTYITSPNGNTMNNNVNYANYNNYGYGNYGYRNNFGYGMNGYGYGYNGYRGYSPFNPGRNTDTYLPLRRNIDTYRPIAPVAPEVIENEAVVTTSEEVNINENDIPQVKDLNNEDIGKNTNVNKKKPGRIIAKTQEIISIQ